MYYSRCNSDTDPHKKALRECIVLDVWVVVYHVMFLFQHRVTLSHNIDTWTSVRVTKRLFFTLIMPLILWFSSSHLTFDFSCKVNVNASERVFRKVSHRRVTSLTHKQLFIMFDLVCLIIRQKTRVFNKNAYQVVYQLWWVNSRCCCQV